MKFYRPLFVGLVEALDLTLNQNKISTHVLETTFKKNKKWGSKDRKAIAEAFYEIIKWQLLLKKSVGEELGEHVACLAAYYLSSQGFKFEEFSGWGSEEKMMLQESVSLGQKRPFDSKTLKHLDNKDLPIYERYSFTQEFHEKLVEEVSDVESFYKNSQVHAPLFIRANLNQNTVSDLAQKLSDIHFDSDTSEDMPYGLKVHQKANIFKTDLFKEGCFEVQDGGSQQISPFLQVEPGHFVVDACAGGGGKSLHISNLMENKGRILSMDIHAWKLEELKKRARRNKCHNIETRAIEGTKTIKRLKDKVDRLLLDVPCSGSGVFRRNPDAKYKWKKSDFQEIESLQSHILSTYSAMVKPGGKLVYSTCSVFSSENEKQVQAFLEANPEWTLEAEKHISVGENEFDGYYMARLSKK